MISFFLFYIIYLFLGLKTCLTLLSLSFLLYCGHYSGSLESQWRRHRFPRGPRYTGSERTFCVQGRELGKFKSLQPFEVATKGKYFSREKGKKTRTNFLEKKINNSKLQWKRGYYGWQFCWFQFSQKLLWYLSLREQMWHTWLYCTETNSCWAFEFWGNRYETLDPTRIWLFWSQTVSLIMPFTFSRFTLLLVFQY